jgi:hypothetical protein
MTTGDLISIFLFGMVCGIALVSTIWVVYESGKESGKGSGK